MLVQVLFEISINGWPCGGLGVGLFESRVEWEVTDEGIHTKNFKIVAEGKKN